MAYMVCSKLLLGYDGAPIAGEISFQVNPGDYLCILGENGAGKSTLLKAVLGLAPPLSGSIAWGDGLNQGEIGYLPQQTAIQKDFPASVWEIVLSGNLARCGRRPFYGKKEKQAAMANLERMGIQALRQKCYRDLSGGQQQRVLLARALCAASKVILLDEPVANLDPNAAAVLYRVVRRLNQEGISVIMVSHDLHAALGSSSHILHLDKERSFFGTKEEYLNSKARKIFEHSVRETL